MSDDGATKAELRGFIEARDKRITELEAHQARLLDALESLSQSYAQFRIAESDVRISAIHALNVLRALRPAK